MNQLTARHGLGRAALTGVGLGAVAGAAAAAAALGPVHRQPWCAYALALCAFHLLEFVWAARFEPATVSCDAFLLNHSPQYHAALAAAAVEYWLEAWLLPPGAKGWGAVSAAGLALVVGGQALRTAAMWTAGGHFTHLVAESRREGHKLVTAGVYARLRHPAYTGWFWWSVGTQLLLCNPLCVAAYAAASWLFFAERIPREEAHLRGFFGQAYDDYAARTYVLIPLLRSGGGGGGGGGGGDDHRTRAPWPAAAVEAEPGAAAATAGAASVARPPGGGAAGLGTSGPGLPGRSD
jgi:protein-S-isoprenylcysteine O-methyltransferase